jgi:ATP-dependent Clp protease ATP-binding subunit ClpC
MISFANTIIILTSNVGARDLGAATSQGQIGFAPTAQPAAGRLQLPGERRRRIVLDEMQRVFSPEFINRLDDVVVFRWLDRPELELIARRFIDELNQRLGNRGHRLVVSSAAIRLLVEKGFDLKSGARQLSRAIRKYVEDPLAEAIVDGTPFEACTIYLQCAVGGQELAPFRYKKRFLPPAPPPSETEPSPLPRRLRPRPPMPPGTELVPIPPDSSE